MPVEEFHAQQLSADTLRALDEMSESIRNRHGETIVTTATEALYTYGTWARYQDFYPISIPSDKERQAIISAYRRKVAHNLL